MEKSFTTMIKAELSSIRVASRHCRLAQAMALSIYGSESAAAKKCLAALDIEERRGGSGVPLVTEIYNPIVVKSECCKKAFLRGAFIALGYCADALGAGHLEFSARAGISPVKDALEFFGVKPRFMTRKGKDVLYIKDGGEIADLLALMGANRCCLEYENGRVEKEVNNNINRAANCEAANADKLASASVKQVEDIRKIEAAIGLDSLPEKLKEVAVLRMASPEMPLSEMAAKLAAPITKSGVNHRFKRISRIAEEIEG